MVTIFLYGILSGIFVSICLYGSCAVIQFVRSAPDDI